MSKNITERWLDLESVARLDELLYGYRHTEPYLLSMEEAYKACRVHPSQGESCGTPPPTSLVSTTLTADISSASLVLYLNCVMRIFIHRNPQCYFSSHLYLMLHLQW